MHRRPPSIQAKPVIKNMSGHHGTDEEQQREYSGPKDQRSEIQPSCSGSVVRKKRLPKDYASAIRRHSTRSEHESLYPGVQYRSIARFLTVPTSIGPNNGTFKNHIYKQRKHSFAILHDLAYGRDDPRYFTSFGGPSGPQQLATHPAPHDHCGQLLFLRGYPSQDWINSIGARYRVDPEIFRRQLQHGPKCEYFDLPDLPSSSMNIIKLFTTTIGTRRVIGVDHSKQDNALERHFHNLGLNPDVVGESIVRQLWIHDEKHFSIEQNILMTVLKREEGWLALILLDHGRDLDEGPLGPWLASTIPWSKFDKVFQPVIQFEPRIWSMDTKSEKAGAESDRGPVASQRPYSQSASLLAGQQYGAFLSPALMQSDPFYALHGVFSFCASAESQFINALKAKIDTVVPRDNDDTSLQKALKNFRYHKSLLRAKIEQLEDVVECIRIRGNPKWHTWRPIPSTSTHSSFINPSHGSETYQSTTSSKDFSLHASLQAEADTAADKLLRDYEALLRRARALARLYSEEIDDIRTTAALMEAKKNSEQAESVGRLSFLALLFLPLSFTSGLFGMNFKEIGTHRSIWIWIALSVPIFLGTLVICFWPRIYAALRTCNSLHKITRQKCNSSQLQEKIAQGSIIEHEAVQA